jgi:hypothetical protein
MAKDDYYGITDQTKASRQRLEDAWSLFRSQRWQGAMYLAGYAVECLLKSKLMRMFGCKTLPELESELDRRKMLPRNWSVFTHQLFALLRLTQAHGRLRQSEKHWMMFTVINHWKPAWRYSPRVGRAADAEGFLNAVEGLLRWIDANI